MATDADPDDLVFYEIYWKRDPKMAYRQALRWIIIAIIAVVLWAAYLYR